MENYINEALLLKDLPKRCWIVRENEYNLTDEKENQLPVIPKKYEYILKDLGINSYRIFEIERKRGVGKFIRYWDQNLYEEEEVELPAYEFYGKKFHLVGLHKGMIPTKDSVKAAQKLNEKVDAEINKVKKAENLKLLEDLLGNKNAEYVKRCTFKGNLKEGVFEHYHIFFIRGKEGNLTNHIIIFDLDKIYDEDVVIEIPESYVDFVLGEDNCNANKWREKLGVDKIQIDVI